MKSDADHIRELKDRIEYLEEVIVQMRRAFAPAMLLPREWRVGKSRRRLLSGLYAAPNGYLSKEACELVLFEGKEVQESALSAHITLLRKELRPFGFDKDIITVWGEGFRIGQPLVDKITDFNRKMSAQSKTLLPREASDAAT